ncbi:unnamed protein product, partial [Mesorhabditis spiculigera]
MAIDFSEYVTEFLSIVLLAGLKAGVYYLLQLIIIILRGTGATFMIDPSLAQDTSGDEKILLFYGDAVRMVKDNGSEADTALLITLFFCTCNDLFASEFEFIIVIFLLPVLPQTALYCVITLIKNFRETLFSLIAG